MNSENWLLSEGKVYKLVESFISEQEAANLAQSLNENCQTIILRLKDGKWAVYWRPYTGIICPYGVV